MPADGLLGKLRACLTQGRDWLTGDLIGRAGASWDAAALEELETRLLTADVGVEATSWLTERLARGGSRAAQTSPLAELRELVAKLLQPVEHPFAVDPSAKPYVILVVGVNGTGKTTTIGKLAATLKRDGHSVLLAAGDTFRAAAVEQLSEWARRSDLPIVAQSSGADPAAVVFDALNAARSRGIDVVIADTAGRLHTAGNLMEELKKIKRVIARFDPDAPHETLLVIDASQGQNALAQASQFHSALGVTGLVITKLDGTAKGGILLAIARQLAIPVRFLGVGESQDDLLPFDAQSFAAALLEADAA